MFQHGTLAEAKAVLVMEPAALAISAVALAVSGFVYWRQVHWARVAADAQERLVRIEEDRRGDELRQRSQARLHARFVRSGKSVRFVVENLGGAIAHNVNATLAPTPGLQGKAPRLHEMPFPATIDPGGQVSALSIPFAGMVATCNVTLSWLDDAGNQRQQTLQVSTR